MYGQVIFHVTKGNTKKKIKNLLFVLLSSLSLVEAKAFMKPFANELPFFKKKNIPSHMEALITLPKGRKTAAQNLREVK